MSPEQYVRWYAQTIDSIGAPGVDLVKSRGLVYAKRCGAKRAGPPMSKKDRASGRKPRPKICTARIRHWSYAERQWVCGRCGMPWRSWVKLSLRGEIQESATKGDGSERRLQRMVDVGLAIRRLEKIPWDGPLYMAHALGMSYRQIAEAGAKGAFGRNAPFTWGHVTVRRRAQAGGAAWREILQQAGLPYDEAS